jgi:RNA polymerase sigma-70 factor (ECF subfamily)
MTDEAARRRFREVVAPSLDDAYSLARYLAGNGTDAEDIVQEAAMRALNALERSVVDNPRAWFLRIVRNAALTWIARNRPKAISFTGDLTDLELMEDPTIIEPVQNPEQILIAGEERETVRRAIADLPSPLRETLIMREVNGLNYREIADATETPLGTVMSRLSRARAMVAKSLGAMR